MGVQPRPLRYRGRLNRRGRQAVRRGPFVVRISARTVERLRELVAAGPSRMPIFDVDAGLPWPPPGYAGGAR